MSFARSHNTDLDVALKTAMNKMAYCKNAEATTVAKPLPKSSSASSRPTFQAASSDGEPPHRGLNILSLNEDVFQAILSHLSYDEVAKLRLVCIQLCFYNHFTLIIKFHCFLGLPPVQ